MNAFYPFQHQSIAIDYTYGDYSEIRSLLNASDNSYKIKYALIKKLFEITYCISVDRSVCVQPTLLFNVNFTWLLYK